MILILEITAVCSFWEGSPPHAGSVDAGTDPDHFFLGFHMDVRDPVPERLGDHHVDQLDDRPVLRDLRGGLADDVIRFLRLHVFDDGLDGADGSVGRLQYPLDPVLGNQDGFHHVHLAHPADIIDGKDILGVDHADRDAVADLKQGDGLKLPGDRLGNDLNDGRIDDVIRKVHIRQPQGRGLDPRDVLLRQKPSFQSPFRGQARFLGLLLACSTCWG